MGLTEAEVTISSEKLDTENGVAVYEVDFVKGNVKYEYDINATTGAVYSKSSESTAVPTTEAAAQPSEAETAVANATVAPTAENRSNNNYIGLERAKAIALGDAGLSAASVTFTEAKQDFDDSVPNYDLDFYTATHEYDYEINAQTGAIMDKSVEVNEHAVRETKPQRRPRLRRQRQPRRPEASSVWTVQSRLRWDTRVSRHPRYPSPRRSSTTMTTEVCTRSSSMWATPSMITRSMRTPARYWKQVRRMIEDEMRKK